jgi:TonB family protein
VIYRRCLVCQGVILLINASFFIMWRSSNNTLNQNESTPVSAATASTIQLEDCSSSLEVVEVPLSNVVVNSYKKARALESQRLFRKTLCVSLGVHLAVVGLGWFLLKTYFSHPNEMVLPHAPELFEVSIVPLSALETVLVKGSPVEKPIEPPAAPKQSTPPETAKEKPQPPEVAVPKKKVESSRPVRERPQRVTVSEPPTTTVGSAAVSNTVVSEQSPGFVNGTESSNEKARLNYQQAVAMLLARAKRYPERALRRGVTGEATIRIEIRSDGSLAEFEILRSAGASVLDEELRAMVDRAAPFPSFPGDLRRDSLALVVPVAFTIK